MIKFYYYNFVICDILIIEIIVKEWLNMKAKLESERIKLRNYVLEDIDDYYDYIKSEDISGRIGFPPYKSKEQAFERLKIETKKPYQFAIVLKSENKVVGSIEIMLPSRDREVRAKFEERYVGIDAGENPVEIGFLLSPKFWGLGIMPEATVLATDYAFNTLGASAVCIGHLKANANSGRVQEKIGFKIVNEIKTDKTWIDGSATTSVRRIMTKDMWNKIRKEKFKEFVK